MAVREKTAETQLAAAAVRCELLNLNAILGEHHGAIDVAESVGQVSKGSARIHELKPPTGMRMRQGAAYVDRKVRRTVRQDVGVESLRAFVFQTRASLEIVLMSARIYYA